jgi:hypothetical protein
MSDGQKSETALRGIHVADESPVTPRDQAAPRLEWVRIADLVIDDRYQRPLNRANWAAIRAIAEDFLWARFAPVIVAPVAGGKLALIDGQHRSHAAAICGFETVPAMIVPISRAEQAAAFAGINGQVTRITLHHVYKAALAAGEMWAERSQLAVERAGCVLMTYNKSTAEKRVGEVYCIALVRQFVTAGRGDAVTAVLSALRSIDGGTRASLYSDFVLRPLFAAVASDVQYTRMDLAGFLRAHDPYKMLDRLQRDTGSVRGGKDAMLRLLQRHAMGMAA